jgi:hypothetical protein
MRLFEDYSKLALWLGLRSADMAPFFAGVNWDGPGYRVYRHEINEEAKTLKLWVRRKRGNRKLVVAN